MTKTLDAFSFIYAYIRCSSDGQMDGNSFERQREAVRKRLRELGVDSSQVQWLEDPGLSAFSGKNIKEGEMGKFLKRVRSGALRDGLFVCETVSRATRQGGFVLLTMLNDLLDAGFSILFLDRQQPFKKDSIPRFLSVELTLLADLAREESQLKSQYAKDNWERRRKAARENPGTVFTAECPNWLTAEDGRYAVIPDRVEAIREIYKLALDGYGISKLVRHANTKPLAAPGKKGTWHMSLIKRVLTNRAVIGEFQPHIDEGGKRVPLGDVIENYYPCIIERDTFFAVQALRARAQKFPARRDDNNFNYLRGLAKCECGGAWRRMNKNSGAQEGYALYGCSNRTRAATDCANINARMFDHQFVAFACAQIPQMLSAGENRQSEKALSLEAQLTKLAERKSNVMAVIEENADLHEEFAVRLRTLAQEQKAIAEELAQLKANDAPPPGFTFGDAVEIFIPAYLDVFPAGSEQAEDAYRARTLFRSRIEQAVESVWVSQDRSAVKVKLKNGAECSFVIETDEPEGDAGYGQPESAEELDHVAGRRREQVRRARQLNNPSRERPSGS